MTFSLVSHVHLPLSGQSVHSLKVGQRVFVTGRNSGAYAEYLTCEETYVFPLHTRLSFAQGAALGTPYFTAYKALITGAQAKPGEAVLVHGASGAVGNAAVQIARALGTIVVGTAGTKDGMDVVTRCGAHHVFNHNHKSYEKKMVEHIGGDGFDVIIEHLANINLGHDVQMLREGKYINLILLPLPENPISKYYYLIIPNLNDYVLGARIMVVGCRGAVTINPRHLMLPEASIRGVALGISTPAQWKEMGAAIVAGIEAGWVNPVINREYSMDEVQQVNEARLKYRPMLDYYFSPQVHYDIIHSKGAKGKLVLKVSE